MVKGPDVGPFFICSGNHFHGYPLCSMAIFLYIYIYQNFVFLPRVLYIKDCQGRPSIQDSKVQQALVNGMLGSCWSQWNGPVPAQNSNAKRNGPCKLGPSLTPGSISVYIYALHTWARISLPLACPLPIFRKKRILDLGHITRARS